MKHNISKLKNELSKMNKRDVRNSTENLVGIDQEIIASVLNTIVCYVNFVNIL